MIFITKGLNGQVDYTTRELVGIKHLLQELKSCEIGPMKHDCNCQSAL